MDWLQSIFTGIPPFFLQLIISAGLGLIIGLEREFNTHEDPSHIGGIRTFTLVAVLGMVSGWISEHTHFSVLVALVACFTLLVGLVYYVQTQHGKIGLTTEAALLLTFLLGIANAKGLVQESIAVVVLMTTILSLKARLHQFVRQITEDEMFAFLKFIILALLILPMLPTTPFGPHGLLNARDLGYIAVLVLSLSFAGYLLLKFGSPHKGILWTAIIGGLFSSTMIAWVFSAKSKDRRDLASAYGAGIVLASSIMFVRVFVWLSIFSFDVAKYLLLPLLVMLLVSLIPTWQVIKSHQKSGEAPPLSPGNPLDIKNAVFFVLLYVGITLAMAASREWLSQALIYVSGAVAGIADIDAITISTAKWAATPEGNAREAAIIVLLAVMSNSVFKWLVSVINGPQELRKPVGIGFGAVLVVGLICMVYWLAS
ncbi:MAG TPA: MgtC/SapB family protein [Saprospiraceae bacterium]|nr:MgtC/SapB family protein [Saprospiraceae bacterium]